MRSTRAVAIAIFFWSAAMIAVGLWLAHSGVFGWHRIRFAEVRASTPLSAHVRARLRPRMRRHADAMTALGNAVMMLDSDRVTIAAASVLNDPQLAQPVSFEATQIAAELPPSFHEYEELLKTRAKELLEAAQAHDDEGMVATHAALAWTCASCHAAFAGP